jgi:Protein of unknown function (DUF3309)
MLRTILLIVLVLLVLGALPSWPTSNFSKFSKFLETKSTYPSSILVYARPVPEVSREPQSLCP